MFLTTFIRHFQTRAGLTVLLFAAAAACGTYDPGDFSDAGPEDAGEAGRGGRGGSGGRGGAGGRGTGTAGRPAAATVRCGSATCMAPPNVFAVLPLPNLPMPVACCFDADEGKCGTAAMQGATCEAPAVADARCPGIDLGALGMFGGMGMMTPSEPMSGCCTPNNQCGLDGALFGRGCVANDDARALLGGIPFIGNLVDIPPGQACDAPQENEDDAGI